jgi:hypothetical protein
MCLSGMTRQADKEGSFCEGDGKYAAGLISLLEHAYNHRFH